MAKDQPTTGCANASCDPCILPHASAICDGNLQCAIGQCVYGYTDCNGDAADGCEAALKSDPNNCGTCGDACVYAHAEPKCMNGCVFDGVVRPGLDGLRRQRHERVRDQHRGGFHELRSLRQRVLVRARDGEVRGRGLHDRVVQQRICGLQRTAGRRVRGQLAVRHPALRALPDGMRSGGWHAGVREGSVRGFELSDGVWGVRRQPGGSVRNRLEHRVRRIAERAATRASLRTPRRRALRESARLQHAPSRTATVTGTTPTDVRRTSRAACCTARNAAPCAQAQPTRRRPA